MWETSSTPGYIDDGFPVLWSCSVIVRADSDPPRLNMIHTTNTSTTKVCDYRGIKCHNGVCITWNHLKDYCNSKAWLYLTIKHILHSGCHANMYSLNMQHAIGRLTGGKILPIKMYDYSGLMQKKHYTEVAINNKPQKYNRNIELVRHVLSYIKTWLTDGIQFSVAPSHAIKYCPLDSNNDKFSLENVFWRVMHMNTKTSSLTCATFERFAY